MKSLLCSSLQGPELLNRIDLFRMVPAINPIAILVFCACFALVTVAGFLAARWRAADLNSLEEWGLAGRKFGTLTTWFLIGGDFYTAYTVIAVPRSVIWNRGIRILCDSLLHSPISVHDAGAP